SSIYLGLRCRQIGLVKSTNMNEDCHPERGRMPEPKDPEDAYGSMLPRSIFTIIADQYFAGNKSATISSRPQFADTGLCLVPNPLAPAQKHPEPQYLPAPEHRPAP